MDELTLTKTPQLRHGGPRNILNHHWPDAAGAPEPSYARRTADGAGQGGVFNPGGSVKDRMRSGHH